MRAWGRPVELLPSPPPPTRVGDGIALPAADSAHSERATTPPAPVLSIRGAARAPSEQHGEGSVARKTLLERLAKAKAERVQASSVSIAGRSLKDRMTLKLDSEKAQLAVPFEASVNDTLELAAPLSGATAHLQTGTTIDNGNLSKSEKLLRLRRKLEAERATIKPTASPIPIPVKSEPISPPHAPAPLDPKARQARLKLKLKLENAKAERKPDEWEVVKVETADRMAELKMRLMEGRARAGAGKVAGTGGDGESTRSDEGAGLVELAEDKKTRKANELKERLMERRKLAENRVEVV